MTQFLVFDIETVANDRAKDYFNSKRYTAPKNWKDAAKIAEHIQEARHEDMQKAALRWWTGQVVCIAVMNLTTMVSRTFMGPDEKEVISSFFTYLAVHEGALVGKNGDTFDKPFLVGRALAHDLGIPMQLRPWRPIADVNDIFGYSSRCDQIGRLDDYAFGLGIPMKTGHGTDVQHWFNSAVLDGDGEAWGRIGTYCQNDNQITATILQRWLKPFPAELPAAHAPSEQIIIPFG